MAQRVQGPEQEGAALLDGEARLRRVVVMRAFGGARDRTDVRRVRGLRREEVADLAGVSADYYTQLERGDIGGASDGVLDAVARALRLDEVELAHLRDLAAPVRRRRGAPDLAQQPDPGLLRLMDALAHLPVLAFAFVLVLSRVGFAVALLPGLGEAEPPPMLRAGLALAVTALLLPGVAPLVPCQECPPHVIIDRV